MVRRTLVLLVCCAVPASLAAAQTPTTKPQPPKPQKQDAETYTAQHFMPCRKWLELRANRDELEKHPESARDADAQKAIGLVYGMDEYIVGYARGFVEGVLLTSDRDAGFTKLREFGFSSAVVLANMTTFCVDNKDKPILDGAVALFKRVNR
jgi:hypothetical protein